ncbi:MAG: hypothetical protein ACJAS4_003751 [Bacteriovoracaceae bacterium]|jgi:hypothetical protein
MTLLLITLGLVGCNEKLKLASCDLKVYHSSSKDKNILDEISNELYYSKGWNIELIQINDTSEINRKEQHAIFSRFGIQKFHRSTTVNPLGWGSEFDQKIYNHKVTCTNKLSFGFPELGKTDTIQYQKSYVTDYGLKFYDQSEIKSFVDKTCESSVHKLMLKIPSCEIR